jgi:hypothetical protein
MSREIENTKRPNFNKSKTYLVPLLSEVLDLSNSYHILSIHIYLMKIMNMKIVYLYYTNSILKILNSLNMNTNLQIMNCL